VKGAWAQRKRQRRETTEQRKGNFWGAPLVVGGPAGVRLRGVISVALLGDGGGYGSAAKTAVGC